MEPLVTEFPLLTALFFLWLGFVISASVLGLAYLAYRRVRRRYRPRRTRK